MDTSLHTPFRLSPGFHLIPSEEGWLLLRPDGLFARLKVKPELSVATADLLAGDAPQASSFEAEELKAFHQALSDQGVIIATSPADDPPAEGITKSTERSRVTVEGDGPIASRLIELLQAGGLDTRSAPRIDADAVSHTPSKDDVPDLIVCCASWLPDAYFSARDAWCSAHDVAWHGVYGEGCRFHLGPFWLPDDPRTVRYADARARRLAAGGHPEGLEAYWRYLDVGRGVPAFLTSTPAEAALIAGALAADILAWAEWRQPPSHGHQLAFDRTTVSWRRHPILPVPRGLMTERVL